MSSPGAASALGQGVFMAAAPEVAVPLEAAKQILPYAPSLMMAMPIVVSIIFIIVSIIMLSAMQSKLPGSLLLVVGLLMGGGAFWIIHRNAMRGRPKRD